MKSNKNAKKETKTLNDSGDDFASPLVFKKVKPKATMNQSKSRRKPVKRQVTLEKLIRDNFYAKDRNGDELQMALALSKSLSEQEDTREISIPLESQKKGRTLMEYGFKSNKEKMHVENKFLWSEQTKSRKKSKFFYVTPILLMRTEEERAALIQSKLASILSQNGARLSLEAKINFQLSSEYLKRLKCESHSVFHIGNVLETTFEVIELDIIRNVAQCGYLLKEWSRIPFRDATPIRSNVSDVDDCKILGADNNLDLEVSPDLFKDEYPDNLRCSLKIIENEPLGAKKCLDHDFIIEKDGFSSSKNCFTSEKGIDHYDKYSSNESDIDDEKKNQACISQDDKFEKNESVLLDVINNSNIKIFEFVESYSCIDKNNVLVYESPDEEDFHLTSKENVISEEIENKTPINKFESCDLTSISDDDVSDKDKAIVHEVASENTKDQKIPESWTPMDSKILATHDVSFAKSFDSISVSDDKNIPPTYNENKVMDGEKQKKSPNFYAISSDDDDFPISNREVKQFSLSPRNFNSNDKITSDFKPNVELHKESCHLNQCAKNNIESKEGGQKSNKIKVKVKSTFNSPNERADQNKFDNAKDSFSSNYSSALNITEYIDQMLNQNCSDLKTAEINVPLSDELKIFIANSDHENNDILYVSDEELNYSSAPCGSDELPLTSFRRFASFDEKSSPKESPSFQRYKSESNITPKRQYHIKTENITPMANYEGLDTPQIIKELDKFGLKPMKRKRGINLLKHIYEMTHPIVGTKKPVDSEEVESNSKRMRTIESRDSTYKRLHCSEEPWMGDIKESDLIFERKRSSKVPSCAIPLQIVWHNFLTENPPIKKQILLYEPLQVDVVHQTFKTLEFQFHVEDLIKFFDQKCITIKLQQKSNNGKI